METNDPSKLIPEDPEEVREANRLASQMRLAKAMAAPSTWHPSDDFLHLYLRNEDSPQSHETISDHLEECEDCSQRLASMKEPGQ